MVVVVSFYLFYRVCYKVKKWEVGVEWLCLFYTRSGCDLIRVSGFELF